MNPRKKVYALFSLVILAALAVGCETNKANKFIDEGNAAVKESEKMALEADAKINELAAGLENFPENRDQLKGTSQEIIDRLDKSIAKLKEAASKFNEGSKTNIDAPLKEYLSLKSQEFAKHAEHLETLKDIPNSVMDASIDDRPALEAKFAQIKGRVEKLEKEWTDFSERARKIQDDNKDKFKS